MLQGLPAVPAPPPPAASASPSDASGPAPSAGPAKGPLIGGIVAGVAGLVALVGLVALCLARWRAAASAHGSPRDRAGGPYGQVISAPILHPGSYRSDFLRGNPVAAASPPAEARSAPRISIPNPFDSPDPSPYSPLESRASVMSADELTARTGHVAASRLAPIRAMRPSDVRRSRRMSTHDARSEHINIFADPATVSPRPPAPGRLTTMSDMMDAAGLGDVHRGRRPYVPGSTPRI